MQHEKYANPRHLCPNPKCRYPLEYLYTSNGYDQLYCHSCSLAVSRPCPAERLDDALRLEELYGE